MPELPDVQMYKRRLDATSLHRRIGGVEVEGRGMLKGVSLAALRRLLEDREIASSRRHGKHLFLEVEGEGRWLRLHFGMTGELVYWSDDGRPDHVRLRLDFADDGHLGYRSVRKLGAIGVVDDPDAFIEERGLGPDPLEDDVDLELFRERLEGKRGSIKGTLLDQKVLAGLGNVYVDEILFQAGLHPRTSAADLDPEDAKDLHRSLRRVLEQAVERRADPGKMPRTWLIRHREGGARCPRCGGEIRRSQVAGRPTYHCRSHQEGG